MQRAKTDTIVKGRLYYSASQGARQRPAQNGISRGSALAMASIQARFLPTVLILLSVAFIGSIAWLVLGAPQGFVGYRTAFETLRLLAWIGLGGTLISAAIFLLRRRNLPTKN